MWTGKRLSALVMILLVGLSGSFAQLTETAASKEKGNEPEKSRTPAETEAIDKLIAQLGADSYQKREEAVRRLIAIGPAASEALQQVIDDKRVDPDVRLRAARAAYAISTVKIEMVRLLGVHNSERANPAFRRATRVAVSPDGKHAVTTGTDNIRFWDLVSGKQLRAFGANQKGYRSVAFAPDGQRIAAGGRDNKIYLFDINTGKILHEMTGHTQEVWSVLFAADGKQVLTGSPDRSIRVWDAATGKQVRAFPGVRDSVRCLALSPDGKLLAVGYFRLGLVQLWDVLKGTLVRVLNGHEAEITGVAFSADGQFLASSSFDQTIRIWRVADGKEQKCMRGHKAHVEGAVFTPDGRRIVSCAWDEDPTLRLWDVASGKQLGESEKLKEGLLSIAVLPDGQHALTAGKDGAVRLWRWSR